MKNLLIVLLVVIISGGAIYILGSNKTSNNFQTPQESKQQNTSASTSCTGQATATTTEGPYYKAGSPEKTNLYSSDMSGGKFTLTGIVYDSNCKPIPNAWIDFWQADGNGNYDNNGYTLRGHQYTDSNGKYTLITVVPGEYPGRTPHIHVKVRATDTSPVLTSQVYFPGVASNDNDSIFNESLLATNIKDTDNGKSGIFNFVVEK